MKSYRRFVRTEIAVLSLSVFLALIGAGCSSASKSGPAVAKTKATQLFEDFFEEELKLNPLMATAIGDHRFDDQLEILISPAHRLREKEMLDRYAATLAQTPCEESEKLSCEIFKEELDTSRALWEVSLDHLLPFDQFDSFHSDFAELASGAGVQVFQTAADYDRFLKRVEVIPAYFDAMIANMNEGLVKGITTPRVLIDRALPQFQGLLPADYKKSIFYKPVTHFDKAVSADDQKRITAAYDHAVPMILYPAYRKLETYVRTVYRPRARKTHGLSALDGGNAYYQALIKSHTTTDLKPDEIMRIGLNEVKRIRNEFETLKSQFDYRGGLREFFRKVRKDPKFYPFTEESQVLAAYHQIHRRIEAKVDTLFKTKPKAAFEIKEFEKFKAESAAESYQNASMDNSRPGIFWVPIPHPKKYCAKDMESLFLHEAIPGHHYQISLQQELDLPRFRRFGGNNAYVEGWALYCESLGKKLGLYTDAYQWLGHLEAEMHRAVRLVVDTGLHAMGWTREQAIEFSLENEPRDEAGIVSEVERYMAIPGQALSYKIGELKIMELRERARRALGSKFDIREFHEQVLKDGALPMKILERKVTAWIGQKK